MATVTKLASDSSGAPPRAGAILATLIIIAAVANLPLAMANVALPSIGAYFDATQTQLNLVAVAYSLGLACSVLWFGALGDRYGRKQIAVLGVLLAIPAAMVCAAAPSIQILTRAACSVGLRRCGARARHVQSPSRGGRRLAVRSARLARCCPSASWAPSRAA